MAADLGVLPRRRRHRPGPARAVQQRRAALGDAAPGSTAPPSRRPRLGAEAAAAGSASSTAPMTGSSELAGSGVAAPDRPRSRARPARRGAAALAPRSPPSSADLRDADDARVTVAMGVGRPMAVAVEDSRAVHRRRRRRGRDPARARSGHPAARCRQGGIRAASCPGSCSRIEVVTAPRSPGGHVRLRRGGRRGGWPGGRRGRSPGWRALARNAQVMVVTHLPQVAALRRPALGRRKDRWRAQSPARGALASTGRRGVDELARMLAGVADSDARSLPSTPTSCWMSRRPSATVHRWQTCRDETVRTAPSRTRASGHPWRGARWTSEPRT